MKITVRSETGVTRHGEDKTYAGNGGSGGLYLHVKGFPARITFDSAAEAFEIAGAILAGLHHEIEREIGAENP